MARLLISVLPLGLAMKCPGSPAWIHASARVEALADASCAEVLSEIKARVQNCSLEWQDPHNAGHYVLDAEADLELQVHRQTGNKMFTDKMTLTFSEFPGAKPSCGIHACSESQIFSIKDFSTNYCNLRNLYCGKEDGCVPMKYDFKSSEMEVDTSKFAGEDKTACIVPKNVPMLRTVAESNVMDDTLSCINGHCPLDETSLRPSALCVLSNCSSSVAKCLFSSSCRDGVLCEAECAKPLVKTADGKRFASLMSCMRRKCPGFPPSKTCAALNCVVEAGECALHEQCRHALECADACVPAMVI